MTRAPLPTSASWPTPVLIALAILAALATLSVSGVEGGAALCAAMAFYFAFMGCIRRVPGGHTVFQRILFRAAYWLPLILPVLLIEHLRQGLTETLTLPPMSLALGIGVGHVMSVVFLYPSRQLYLDRNVCMLAIPPMQKSDLLLSLQSMAGAAIFEEVMFRYAVFALIGHPALALAVSTLLFVAAHYCLPWADRTFSRRDYCNQAMTGLLLGTLFWITEALLACIIAHLIFNLLRLGPAVLRFSIYGDKNELYES